MKTSKSLNKNASKHESDDSNMRSDARQILREESDLTNIEIGKRLAVAVDLIGSPGVAAEAAGVSVSTLQRYLRGEVSAPFVALAGVARRSGVSLDWLATGEGPRNARGEKVSNIVRTRPLAPDEDPDFQGWPVDTEVFFPLVRAADTVGADLEMGDRTEIARLMYLAVNLLARQADNRKTLEEEDFAALARIVRKLIGMSQ